MESGLSSPPEPIPPPLCHPRQNLHKNFRISFHIRANLRLTGTPNHDIIFGMKKRSLNRSRAVGKVVTGEAAIRFVGMPARSPGSVIGRGFFFYHG